MPGKLTGVGVWDVICTNIRYIKQSLSSNLNKQSIQFWTKYAGYNLSMHVHMKHYSQDYDMNVVSASTHFLNSSHFRTLFIDLLAAIILSHCSTFSVFRRETNRALYQPSFCMRIRKRLKKSVPHSITDKWVISFIYFHECVWRIHHRCAPGRHPNEKVERFMAVSSQHAVLQLSSADVFSVGCQGRQTL